MAFDNIILVDLIGEIVDSMRATGTITSSSEVSGRYTIISANTFKDREVVNIDSVDYVVYDPTATQFEIEAATGLDFTGLSWKALAPYYIHGHPIEITNRLNRKNSGVYQYQKYPLIALLQDFEETADQNVDFYATASPDIAIVNFTEKNINADDRYDLNFRNVLYPLYYQLLHEIYDNGAFNIRSPKLIVHSKTDRPYYGESGENGNTANKKADPLDAIVINSIELQMIDTRCNF
jgi:hypothetical protein